VNGSVAEVVMPRLFSTAVNDSYKRGQTLTNIVGWVLIAAGVIGLFAGIAGAVYVVFRQSLTRVTDSTADLYLQPCRQPT
jgi:hypothetical protein